MYPIEPGEYTPILFIPGLNGVVYPEVYSTVSARIASFGYVLIEVDLYWPVEDTLLDEQSIVGINKRSDFILEDVDNLKRNPELAFKVLDWVRDKISYCFECITLLFRSAHMNVHTMHCESMGISPHATYMLVFTQKVFS